MVEDERVHRHIRALHNALLRVLGDEGVGAMERSAAMEALVWLMRGDERPLVSASQLVKVASQGGRSRDR